MIAGLLLYALVGLSWSLVCSLGWNMGAPSPTEEDRPIMLAGIALLWPYACFLAWRLHVRSRR